MNGFEVEFNKGKLMSQNIKPGYKKTEIGWIPEDWDFLKFEDVSKIDNKNLKANTNATYGFYYISL